MTEMYKVQKTVDAVVGDGQVALAISRTDGKKGKSGLCIVVPVTSDAVVSVVQNGVEFAPWLVAAIDDIKSRIASAINKKQEAITSDKLGVAAILAAMKAETESQRMTKEAIGTWFDADLAPAIAARIVEKMTGIAADKVAKLVEGYKLRFQSLAGRDVSMDDKVKAQLITALELLTEEQGDSVIALKVMEKLTEVSEATEVLAAL